MLISDYIRQLSTISQVTKPGSAALGKKKVWLEG